jgi:hypothetical protein
MRLLIDMDHFIEVDRDVFQPQPTVALYATESPISQAMIQLYVLLPLVSGVPCEY